MVNYYSYYIFILFPGPMTSCCGRYITHFTKKTCCNLHARRKTPASMVHILLKSKLNISMNGSSSHSEVGQSQQILLERGWPTVVGWLQTTVRGFCLWSVTVWWVQEDSAGKDHTDIHTHWLSHNCDKVWIHISKGFLLAPFHIFCNIQKPTAVSLHLLLWPS